MFFLQHYVLFPKHKQTAKVLVRKSSLASDDMHKFDIATNELITVISMRSLKYAVNYKDADAI